MTISVGDSVPVVTLKRAADGGLRDLDTGEFFKGRKVLVFGIVGAFTPTCSEDHLPGFVSRAGDLEAKGIDAIACISVNDAWAMKSWGEAFDPEGKVELLPDGNGDLTKAMGLEQDISVVGFGIRSKRYAMLVDDGTVKSLDIEEGRGVTVSGADACLAKLGS